MSNEKNLKRFGKEKPAPTSEQAKKAGSKGGKKSAEKRAQAKTTREILEFLDSLAVTGNNRDKLEAMGIPEEMRTQQTLRIVGLHHKAASGDAQANRLLLEIRGEAPASTVNVEVNNDQREAYDRAAAAIKGTKK